MRLDLFRRQSASSLRQFWTVCVLLALVPRTYGGPPDAGPWKVLPLRGQTQFVFASAAVPEVIGEFNAHLDMMAERELGNGIDVMFGPAPQLVSQYHSVANRGLAAVAWHNTAFPGIFRPGNPGFPDATLSILQILDKPGAPAPVHFGEWDYAFHNLLGIGNKGYAVTPTSKQQAYNYLKAYYEERNTTYGGRLLSVTGHSQYEVYAAEWGTQDIGLELGENIRFSQLKMSMARGAGRQWDLPWSVQVSPWFHGSLTTTGPLTGGPGNARGANAGHSQSLYERLWYHSWFAGAAMVTPEGGSAYLFEEKGAAPYTLTALGHVANSFFRFTNDHDRGIPYTPVAVVIDRYAGYNAYEDKPWGVLAKTTGDQQLHDLFQRQIFPGSGDSNNPDAANPEAPYLVSTPYGEIFDILLSTVPGAKLSAYPEVLLAGDMTFDASLVSQLELALRSGSHLMMSQAHAAGFGANLARLQAAGNVEVLAPWINPATGRPAAISNARLAALAEEHLPIDVSGGTIEYQINRNDEGWVVELINNRGITKKPDLPVVIDASAIAQVFLTPREGVLYAFDWKTGAVLPTAGSTWRLALGPGEVKYIQFVVPEPTSILLFTIGGLWVWRAGLINLKAGSRHTIRRDRRMPTHD